MRGLRACLGYTANVDLSLSDSKPVFLITAHVQFLLVVQRGLHPRLRVCFGQSKFQALFYLDLLFVFLAMVLSALSALPRPLVPIPACGQRPCGYRMRNPIWLLPTFLLLSGHVVPFLLLWLGAPPGQPCAVGPGRVRVPHSWQGLIPILCPMPCSSALADSPHFTL